MGCDLESQIPPTRSRNAGRGQAFRRHFSALRWRLARARQRHGLVGSAGLVLREVASRPAAWRQARLEREFDECHGVDTAGIVHLGALDIASPNKARGVRYQAANPDLVRRLLAEVPIEPRKFVFVDFGCGKGRTALLASERPFERIVGVDFSRELVEVAQANARRYRSVAQKCQDLEFQCLDAVDFEIPREPLVLFFYNPFGEPVMRRVMGRVRDSLDEHPRKAFVVLIGNAPLAGIVEAAGFVHFAGESPTTGVYSAWADAAI
jgi:SAM-dependent methyltransferase